MGTRFPLSDSGRLLLAACILAVGSIAADPAATEPAVRKQVRFEDPRDGIAVSEAINGALTRLEDARCQALFSEFETPSGRRLQDLLDAWQETPQSRLQRLLFYDGSRLASCRAPSPAAFTTPGSIVVFVCGREFRSAVARSRALADAAIIHELLHSVGLGENPPTSKEITDVVLARCAR